MPQNFAYKHFTTLPSPTMTRSTDIGVSSSISILSSLSSGIDDKDMEVLLFDQPNHLSDAGNQSNDHYKLRLSPFRYKIRSKLLPLVRSETEHLDRLQKACRSPLLDYYFAWTANLASHTFYVLMLPVPLWFGSSTLARDLIYTLGFGIYLSGHLKDYFCLPRPRSPPVHRITMSTYTTKEYGFPSSHCANATAVTLVCLWNLYQVKESYLTAKYASIVAGLLVYCLSIVFGRLYCGMHGYFDIATGSLIGVVCFLFRFLWGPIWDNLVLNNSCPKLTSLLIIVGYLGLIHVHAEPVDDCPCFDDSVAFVGVLIGVDLSHLIAYQLHYFDTIDELVISYNFERIGIVNSVLRCVLGMASVVLWKSVSKPVIFTILPPIYKYIGVNLPRRNFIPTAFTTKSNRQIRLTSISNLNESEAANNIGDINNFFKGVSSHNRTEEMGPETEIDYYEMLDYEKQKVKEKEKESKSNVEEFPSIERPKEQPPLPHKVPGVFRPRYDVEIIGRLIVYAGIGITAIWGFEMLTRLLSLI